MATERIENLISKEALEQFSKLKEINDANVSSFEKLIAKTVELNKHLGGAKTFKQVVDGTKELEKAEADLAKQKSDLEKQQAKLNSLYTEEAKRIAELKVQQQEQNKALKEQAREALGLTDAYKRLEQEYNKAAKEAKNLAIQFGAQSKEAQEASKRALELDKRLKDADANVGRFNRNVGNYSGAMKILEKALDDVRKKMDDYTNSGQQNDDVLQALVKEQSLLESLLQNQAVGFATYNAELKEGQKALEQLKAAGLQNTEAFQKLFVEVAKGRDELASFKKELLARGSGEIFLNGAINAAQTLAGIYGVAEGAAALFGKENEELQKTMVKLQAVVAILNGLEAINNVLKKESALRTALNVGLQKISVVQTNLQTAAESKNIVVKYTAIAAQKALNLVTSSAGGPILILIGLLASALTSFASYGKGAEDAAKKNDRLSKSLERSNEILDQNQNIIKQKGEKTLAQLEDMFATESELRIQRLQNMQEELDEVKRFNEIDKKRREDAIKEVQRLTSGKVKQDKEAIDAAIKVRDGYLKNLEREKDLEKAIEIERLHDSRATKEEMIKAQQDELDITKSILQKRLSVQNEIVGNDKKSYEERIAALDEFQKLQTRILQADTQKQLLAPTLTPSQRRLIVAQAKAAQEEINRNATKQRQAFLDEQASRERKAQFDIARASIEAQGAAAQEIASNQDKTFEDRLSASYEYFKSQEALILGQKNIELSNATLTATERQAIEEQANANILAARIAFNKQVRDLTLQNLDIQQDERKKNLADGQATELGALNKWYQQRIDATREGSKERESVEEEYAKRRADIEYSYALAALKTQIEFAERMIQARKAAGLNVAEQEEALHKFRMELSDMETSHVIENNRRKSKDDKKYLAELEEGIGRALSAYNKTTELLSGLISATTERQKAAIDEQIEDLTRKQEKELALVEASTLTEQEKEEEKAVINQRAASQREALERRQRQLDLQRARFDKAANIGRIIVETALAVVHQLGTGDPYTAVARAFAVGAIGAAQLATAIAAPLPKFATGTDDAPGGLAVVGDAYRSELMVTPDGELVKTPAVPTVMNVPKHSIILPDADQAIRAMSSHLAMNHTAPALVDHGRYYREMTSELKTELRLTRRAIINKREVHIHRSRDGWHTITKSGGNQTNYLNNNLQF